MTDALLTRIALALERLAPPPRPTPRDDAPAYVWDGAELSEAMFAPLALDLLTGIDAQKCAFVENLRRHACGHAAHDVLLWGARGMGKSALVKASVAARRDAGADIALIELMASTIATLPALFATVQLWSRPVLVFIDDLGFENDAAAARMLRSVLDGGSRARPAQVRLTVTSNRRHIVARDMAEQDSAINPRDVIDDRLALADRFGLSLGFHNCDQESYLAMVAAYAQSYGLAHDAAAALTFATHRGARSGRVAWHYITECAGAAGRSL